MTLPNAQNRPLRLADPTERPDADVVIYDGQCRFCTAQVQRLARWDLFGRLAFLPLQDPRVGEAYPDLHPEQLTSQMYVVTRSGERLPGALAVRYLTRRLPLLWWLAPLLHLPGTLACWQWCYRQIADRRYRWGRRETCDDQRCRIHDPPDRKEA
jgi:predicted DCC family thiol-disulfide oxidoreductase YuxK